MNSETYKDKPEEYKNIEEFKSTLTRDRLVTNCLSADGKIIVDACKREPSKYIFYPIEYEAQLVLRSESVFVIRDVFYQARTDTKSTRWT